jgi:hypothetical protein
MGGVWETAAFAIRTVGAHDQQQLQFVIWGQLLFLLAPLCMSSRMRFVSLDTAC